jgi:hypothetical protein
MFPHDQSIRRRVCAVPFRVRGSLIEFCIATGRGANRWEFPSSVVADNESDCIGALQASADSVGLVFEPASDQPLDEFNASRGDVADRVIAYLVRVASQRDESPDGRRRRWCLAEEVRQRIRRKPMRRLVDIAVRRVESLLRPQI